MKRVAATKVTCAARRSAMPLGADARRPPPWVPLARPSSARAGKPRQLGYSLLELVFALALGVTVAAAATPPLLASVEEVRTAGAVRYLATRLQRVRLDSVMRSLSVGVQFVQTTGGYTYGVYADGNGNGIRSRDIERGIDVRIAAVERLPDKFWGVDFGLLPGLPPVDGGAPPGTDPIRLGTGNILTFTPLGSGTAGSLYVRGRGGAQYVIRIIGETGKSRVLRFDARARQWKPS
jgi:type II secretory pathway pseudopilin PulG